MTFALAGPLVVVSRQVQSLKAGGRVARHGCQSKITDVSRMECDKLRTNVKSDVVFAATVRPMCRK
jgi:hypothetical protein